MFLLHALAKVCGAAGEPYPPGASPVMRAQAQLDEQAARLTELSLQVSKLQARFTSPLSA